MQMGNCDISSWVVSKSCLEVSIWTFLQSLSWCFEPGCEKRELSDTECSCGNDMPIKKQVYPEVYPFWLKYVPNIRLSMEKSTLNCYLDWIGLHLMVRPSPMGFRQAQPDWVSWATPPVDTTCMQEGYKRRGLSNQLPSYWKLLWIYGAVWWQKS